MAFFLNSFKYLIFLVNLIFFGLGCYLFFNLYQQLGNDIYNITIENIKSPIYFSFVISAVIIIISFLGCCGTYNENTCMIKAYAFLILLCVILQVSVVIMLYKIDPDEIAKEFKQNLISDFKGKSKTVQKSIQIIQQENHCCGVDGWSDYKVPIKNVPDSCCGKFNESTSDPSSTGNCESKDLNGGCKPILTNFYKENKNVVYSVIGLVFGFQLLVVILSCALSKNIREQYNVV